MPKFCKSAKNAFKASEDFIVSCLCHADQKPLLISILQHDSLKRGEVNNSKSPAKNRTPSITMHMICLCLILWEIIKYPQLIYLSSQWLGPASFFPFLPFQNELCNTLAASLSSCVVLCFLVCFTHRRVYSPLRQSAQLVETFLSLSRFSLAFSLSPVLIICTKWKCVVPEILLKGSELTEKAINHQSFLNKEE